MLLTITTSIPKADFGFLLHKNPANLHVAELPFGRAVMGYAPVVPGPVMAAAAEDGDRLAEADAEHADFHLAIEIDPVALAKNRKGPAEPFVSDRAYASASRLSVAIGRTLGSALKGQSRERPELVDVPAWFKVEVGPLPVAGYDRALRYFSRLGYQVSDNFALHTTPRPHSQMMTFERDGTLQELLSHLYVLLPAVDRAKHYFVGDEEVAKIAAHGGAWLASHPHRDEILRGVLKGQRRLVRAAIAQLVPEADEDGFEPVRPSLSLDGGGPLDIERKDAIVEILRQAAPARILDAGCGEARLITRLLDAGIGSEIVGIDPSADALGRAREAVGHRAIDDGRVTLLQSALTYHDPRLRKFDAVVASEVIEHVDPPRLPAIERSLFGTLSPGLVVITTPNHDFNARFGMPKGALRHPDHRFEFTREEFGAWAAGVCERYGYEVELSHVSGSPHVISGPTLLAVFRKEARS